MVADTGACSVIPVAFVGFRQRIVFVGLTRHSMFHVAWVFVGTLFCGLALAKGSTPGALLDGLVLQHLGFADRFYTAAPIYGFASPFAVVVAVGTIWLRSSDARWNRWLPTAVRYARLASLVLFVGIVQRHFADLGSPIEHGLDDRAHAGLLMSLMAPHVVADSCRRRRPLTPRAFLETHARQHRSSTTTDRVPHPGNSDGDGLAANLC